MKSIELKGTLRTVFGKKSSKKVRINKEVPCVLYGGESVVHFALVEKELRAIVYTPEIFVVNLVVEGKTYRAVMKDLQFHPVSDEILHVDFLEVSDDKDVTIKLPVELTGFSVGVKAGGKLSSGARLLTVKGRINDIPERVVVDITNLELGKTLKVSDLSYEKVTILDPKNVVVAAVRLTRATKAAPGEEPKEKEKEKK